MKSMTGFGTSAGAIPNLDIEISVKSINGRFLDVRFHLPREYYPFEAEMKKIVSSVARRGSFDIGIQRKVKLSGSQSKIVIDKSLARKWMSAYKDLAKTLGISEPVRLETLISVPHLIELESHPEIALKEKNLVFSHLRKALLALERERQREGLAIKKDIDGHLQSLLSLVDDMETLREQANIEMVKKMDMRLKQNQLAVSVDETRLAQEVAMLLDRADIGEEIVRLREHLKTFAIEMKSPNCEGKKLDFYTQELLREANTIGSKAQLAPLTQMVVEAKTRIEKVREQIQNVE